MKADLASISSIDENMFLSKLSGQSVWIGLNSIVPVKQRRYVWSDSTPLSFLSHGIDRGSNLGVVVLEGASEKEGYWTRMSCNDSSSYICQKGELIIFCFVFYVPTILLLLHLIDFVLET